MLRHDHVTDDEESVPAADLFERLLEGATCFWNPEERCATVTTEGDEVKVAGLLETVESAGHITRLFIPSGVLP